LAALGVLYGYLPSLFGLGLLAGRYGPKCVVLAAGAASTFLFAFGAHDCASGVVLYSLMALCAGGSYTPVLTLIAQSIPAPRRGWAMGWYIAAGPVGYALSLDVSSATVAYGGWRGALYVAACGPAVGTALMGWV
jgi:hypothetical protein